MRNMAQTQKGYYAYTPLMTELIALSTKIVLVSSVTFADPSPSVIVKLITLFLISEYRIMRKCWAILTFRQLYLKSNIQN